MELTLEIPGDVVETLRFPPDEVEWELRKELALARYQRGVLSSAIPGGSVNACGQRVDSLYFRKHLCTS